MTSIITILCTIVGLVLIWALALLLLWVGRTLGWLGAGTGWEIVVGDGEMREGRPWKERGAWKRRLRAMGLIGQAEGLVEERRALMGY